MCATIKHTFSLMKMSWGVLRRDPELIVFPILSMTALATLGGSLLLVVPMTNDYAVRYTAEDLQLVPISVYSGYVVFFYFIIIFFHAALVSAALERLRGGDPNVLSGTLSAAKQIHYLFIWAVIVAIVMTALKALRAAGRRFWPLALLAAILRGVWLLYTFFVIPVIVTEACNPVSAVKRSVDLVRHTWGQQVAASFGFWFFYVAIVLIAAALGFGVGYYSPEAGVFVGAALLVIGIALLQTLEGIFKAALYDYAVGIQPIGFDLRSLQHAYRPAAA